MASSYYTDAEAFAAGLYNETPANPNDPTIGFTNSTSLDGNNGPLRITVSPGAPSSSIGLANGAARIQSAFDALTQATSQPGAASAGNNPTSTDVGTGQGIDWANWFVRIVVVIIGFIFLAVGLTLFGKQEFVPAPIRNALPG